MEFVDLRTQRKRIASDIDRRIAVVLEHGRFIMGPEITELEQKLGEWAQVEHALSCSSGTDALLLALMAKELGPGDAVLTTTFTFIATAEVIGLLGATPVFVDIEADTFNLSLESLRRAADRVEREGNLRLKGVITVDLFGLPADHDPIVEFARKRDLFVIEDAAQSFGARYGQRPTGGLGQVGATSFFPAKPLGCYGDGGAVFTDDPELAARMKSIRVHGGGTDKYSNVRLGINGRLDTLQAAVLLAKLEIYGQEIEARQRVADAYSRGLEDLVQVPRVPDGFSSVWAQYTIRSDARDRIREGLAEKQIPTATYYPTPLHLQPVFAHLGYRRGELPVAEEAAEQVLSLPMHPYLEQAEQQQIISAVRSCLSR